ncbi:MAG: hypothetical protein SFU53_14935 [Terrimicrobiaceae bacterium]|nr:hypothetical protein [Terrimicrobiaceae bacterium]
MKRHQPIHRSRRGEDTGRIVALSPSGRRFGRDDRLPSLPPSKKMVVGAKTLWVDGWVFRFLPMERNFLLWLSEQASRWCRRDPSPANKQQVLGVIDAVESRVKNAAGPSEPKQGEFDF